MECKVLVLWLDLAGIVLGLAAAIVLLLPPWQELGARQKTGRLKYLRDNFTWRRGAKRIEAALDPGGTGDPGLQAARPTGDHLRLVSAAGGIRSFCNVESHTDIDRP